MPKPISSVGKHGFLPASSDNQVANLILKAIRRRFINRGIHPSRVIHIPSEGRLTIRHANTNCTTAIEHDGLTLFLAHSTIRHLSHRCSEYTGLCLKKISLADPELIDKAVNLVADWDDSLL